MVVTARVLGSVGAELQLLQLPPNDIWGMSVFAHEDKKQSIARTTIDEWFEGK